MKKKLYFKNEDESTAHSEEYFQEEMKEEGMTEMTVMEAIPIPHSKSDYVYCTELDWGMNKNECGKSRCELYKPRNGKSGRCEFRGQYCEFGKEITLKIK